MSNALVIAIPWIGVAVHVVIGIVAARRPGALPLVPLLNLVVALCVLAYWAQRWYGYLARGITWYATDQLLPLYALVVCVLAGVSLAGRYHGTAAHWLVFGVDALALLGAGLLFSVIKFDRMF